MMACSGCGRELTGRPNAICPNVIHWRAWSEECERLPNGWRQPTFLNVDEDGSLNIEWCVGEQGADDSFRIMFAWHPKDGVIACKTERGGVQTLDETSTAGFTLGRMLSECAIVKASPQ